MEFSSQPNLLSYDDVHKLSISDVQDLYKKYVNPGQVEFIGSFGPGRVLAKKAIGNKIYCEDGRVIYDFTGGVGVLNHGHNHPEILEARKRFQNENRMEVHKNFLSPYLAALSSNIAQLMPGDLKISYFCNSGAESVEGAVKLAYKAHNGQKTRIMSADISFHGKLLGSSGLTGSPEVQFQWPTIPNIDRFVYNDIRSIRSLIDANRKKNGESDHYAVIIEPFNASSMLECSTQFLTELRELCDKEDIVLIFDEVYTGWAKTGELFNFFNHKVIPDIVTMSKSFGAGKSSIAGYVTREAIFKRAYGKLNDSIIHSTTYNGFGEECITALEGVRILVRDNYVQKSKDIGNYMKPALEKLKEKHPDFISEVRGRGALTGVILNDEVNIALRTALSMIPSDLFRDTRFIAKLITGAVISELFNEYKILTYFGSNREIPLVVAPPLITPMEDLAYFADSLDKVLSVGKFKLVTRFAKFKYTK